MPSYTRHAARLDLQHPHAAFGSKGVSCFFARKYSQLPQLLYDVKLFLSLIPASGLLKSNQPARPRENDADVLKGVLLRVASSTHDHPKKNPTKIARAWTTLQMDSAFQYDAGYFDGYHQCQHCADLVARDL
ncbi:MAG TPA: hypothetical protein VGD98_14625 [Ktedonobacteraceae bacterium]